MHKLPKRWHAKLFVSALATVALTLSACNNPMGGTNPDVDEEVIATPAVEMTVTLVTMDVITNTITNTESMPGTDLMTDTGTMTDTGAPTAIDPMTATETMTDTGMMTNTGAMDNGDALSIGVMNAQGTLVAASLLLDYGFENIDGEVSGEIDDLLIDTATGRVIFATLEYGGFLGIGNTELPVPLSAFTWNEENGLVLNFPEETLQNMPNVGLAWPNVGDGSWDDELNNFWGEQGFAISSDYVEPTNTVVRASMVIDYPIADLGVGAGRVNDLLIDLGTSHAKYAVVSYGAVTATDEWILVPFSAFDASTFSDEFAYSSGIDLATLDEAPQVDRDQLYSTSPIDVTIDDQIDNFWTERGFGWEEN